MDTIDTPQNPFDNLLAAEWQEAETKVNAYLGFLGVSNEEKLTWLRGRVIERVKTRLVAQPGGDIAALAIEESVALLDEWLAKCLNIPEPVKPQQLAITRAALLLARTQEGFAECLFEETMPPQILETIAAALSLNATPTAIEQAMEPQKLNFIRPIVALRRSIFWCIASLIRQIKEWTSSKQRDDDA